MSQPPRQILELVERFRENLSAYKSPQYNEAQLRTEFLDPFFKELGWDMENKEGYSEAYKEVIHEDAIKMGEGHKAPDYCFRVGGTRKFFVEAKKPSVDIKNDASPAFQLRRYAYTESLPLSILSDFEEFAVYDGRVKPNKHQNADCARILCIPYTEYETRWEEIAGVFSREAVLKGRFDKYAESVKAKRGTSVIDDDFLETIETWRLELALNLALRNNHAGGGTVRGGSQLGHAPSVAEVDPIRARSSMPSSRPAPSELLVEPGSRPRLAKAPTGPEQPAARGAARDELAATVSQIAALQERLYAQGSHSVLVVFQAMDAAGKDSTIAKVMSGINPQGCRVTSFKQPSAEELAHDFLWRATRALPPRGVIGVFNRSHYEETLVVRVHPDLLTPQRLPGNPHKPKELGRLWEQRYEAINAFERHLDRSGTRIVKLFLHVSREEQRWLRLRLGCAVVEECCAGVSSSCVMVYPRGTKSS